MAKLEWTKNASRNVVFGGVLKVYQVVVPFLMRTAVIYLLGVQYLGLNSLFASVLQILNLAEMGIGSAMVFSMYRPIARDDDKTICALLKLYRTYYYVIGALIGIVGLLLTPFIPKLISGPVPEDVSVTVLYLLNLGATVLSYCLFAHQNSILQAYQRTDIISKVTLCTNTVQFVLQIIILWLFRSYYGYVIVKLAVVALTNIVTAVKSRQYYPQYKPAGSLPKEDVQRLNQRIKDLFTMKLGLALTNSMDTVVISAFLGLTVLAVYQNYFFITTAVIGFVSVLFTSAMAGIGNSMAIENAEQVFKGLKKFSFIVCWVIGFCACCLLNLFQPFMELWVGRELMLEFPVVVCLVIYFAVFEINQLFETYKDAGGIWHKDRWRPLICSAANLCMNLISVKYLGLLGIVLSTIVSIAAVSLPWLIQNLFSSLFPKSYKGIILKKIGMYCVGILLVVGIVYFACSRIKFTPLVTLLLRSLICIILPNLLFFLFYKKTDEFAAVAAMIKKFFINQKRHS